MIFATPVDDFSLDEVRQRIQSWLNDGRGKVIATLNPEFILLARENEAFHGLLSRADLCVADGVGLRFAVSALTDEVLVHRHTGVDLVQVICELASQSASRVLLLGGAMAMADRARTIVLGEHPTLSLSSIDPGIVQGDASNVTIAGELIERIGQMHPDVLIVALGQGKQERFIRQILDLIPEIRLAIGVGGAFETIAGSKPRAPLVFRRSGFEWLWRLMIEPSRFHRIVRASFVFPLVVISATLRQHRFLKAVKHTLPELWKQLTNKS